MRSMFSLLIVVLSSASLFAQTNNGGNTGGGGGINNGGNTGNNSGGNAGGILISPDGLVSSVTQGLSPSGMAQRRVAFDSALNADVKKQAAMRFVSLTRLSRDVETVVREKASITPEQFYLAGLTRIDEVFLDEDQGELVIAGPAGAFGPDSENRVVNLETGRPCLRLDDLVECISSVAARQTVECSIDPVAERIVDLQNYIRNNSSPVNVATVKQRYLNMARVLGAQNVRVSGVRPESHLGVTLVEADYRMKKVSLGLENPRVKGFRSHLSMLRPQGNSMQRWWFVPMYEAILSDEDHATFQLSGPRLQLVSQEEIVSDGGQRSDAATTRKSTLDWAQLFTSKMNELAVAMPVFAELQNIIDMLTVSALIQKYELDLRAGWAGFDVDLLRPTFPDYIAPKTVDSLVNVQAAQGGMILGLIAGGVKVDTRQVVSEVKEGANRVGEVSGGKRWWWDGE